MSEANTTQCDHKPFTAEEPKSPLPEVNIFGVRRFPTSYLHNIKTGRYHPLSFKPSPMPGMADVKSGLCRWKSIGHHADGFDTFEQAREWVLTHPSCIEVAEIFDWNGEGVPSMSDITDQGLHAKALFGTQTPGKSKEGEDENARDLTIDGDLHQLGVQDDFLSRMGVPYRKAGMYPVVPAANVRQALLLIYNYRVDGWWHYATRYEELGICSSDEFRVALDVQCAENERERQRESERRRRDGRW